jgi:hypothetical protein
VSKSKWFRISTSKMDEEWFLFLSSGAVKGWLYICKHCEETMYSQKDIGRCSALSPRVLALKANIQVSEAEEVIQTLISVGELVIEGDSWVLTDLSAFASEKTLAKLEVERAENAEKRDTKPQNAEGVGIIPESAEKSGKIKNKPEKVVPDEDADEDYHTKKETPTGVSKKEDQPVIFDLAVPPAPSWWVGWEPESLTERYVILLAHWAASVCWKDGPRAFPDSMIDREKITAVANILAELDPMPEILENELVSLRNFALRKLAKSKHWTYPSQVLMTNIVNRHEAKWRAAKSQRKRESSQPQGSGSVYARSFGRDGSQRVASSNSYIDGEVASAS